jgi:hypothetical protein
VSEVDAIRLRYRAALEAGFRTFIEFAGGESQRRAPVEEGTLRGSMETDVRWKGAEELEGEVTFNEVYAARQHEEDSWEHPKGGQADYLGSVWREQAPRLQTVIATVNRKVFGA